MRTVLITGARGFSGSYLVRYFAGLGDQVYAIVRSEDKLLFKQANITYLRSDLRDFSRVVLPHKIDLVLHTAAQSPVLGAEAEDFLEANVICTDSLTRFLSNRDVALFIYFSTISVNGDIKNGSVSESSPIIDPSMYGVTKYLGERLVAERFPAHLIIRFPAIVGFGASRNWPSRVVDAIKTGNPITLFNAHDPFNNIADIDDVCNFCDFVSCYGKLPHTLVCFACSEITTADHLVSSAIAVAGKSVEIKLEDDNSAKPPFNIDISRLIGDFGYRAKSVYPALIDYYNSEFGRSGMNKSRAVYSKLT